MPILFVFPLESNKICVTCKFIPRMSQHNSQQSVLTLTRDQEGNLCAPISKRQRLSSKNSEPSHFVTLSHCLPRVPCSSEYENVFYLWLSINIVYTLLPLHWTSTISQLCCLRRQFDCFGLVNISRAHNVKY